MTIARPMMTKTIPFGFRSPASARRPSARAWSRMRSSREGGMLRMANDVADQWVIGYRGISLSRPEKHILQRCVGIDSRERGPGLGERSAEELLPLVEDEQVRAQVFDEEEQVRADDDRRAAGGT